MLRSNRNSGFRKIYLFRNKALYGNYKAVDPGFCEKMEVTRVPPGRPSRTTGGTRTTGWEPLFYDLLITFVRGKTDHQYRNGQLIWLMGRFENATYSGGPYFLMANEASLGSSYPHHERLL